jgi:hypothetical protein
MSCIEARASQYLCIPFIKAKCAYSWKWCATSSHAAPTTVATDNLGNIYTVWIGLDRGPYEFYDAKATVASLSVNRDLIVTKTDSCGIFKWAASVSNVTFKTSLCVNAMGNVFVSVTQGTEGNAPKFYDRNGNFCVAGRNSQTHIANLNACGKWQWVCSVDNATDCSIAVDHSDHVYCVGLSTNPKFYNKSKKLVLLGKNVHGSSDEQMFVAQLNNCGHTWSWCATIATEGSLYSPQLEVDCRGFVYVVASSTNTTRFYDKENQWKMTGRTPVNDIQVIVAKICAGGHWKWNCAVDGGSIQALPQLCVDHRGNVFVCGETITQPKFYGRAKDLQLTGRIPDSLMIFVGKLTCDGQWQWEASIDGEGGQFFGSIVADFAGNVYVTGEYEKPQFYGKNHQLQRTGIYLDCDQQFLGKLNSCGHWKWSATIECSLNGAFVNNRTLAVDRRSNLYVSYINDATKFYGYDSHGNTSSSPSMTCPSERDGGIAKMKFRIKSIPTSCTHDDEDSEDEDFESE